MKTLILAAGYGTRLNELTKDKSKCLLKINEKPVIERIIDKLNFHDIWILTNNKFYDDFQRWFNSLFISRPINSDIRLISDETETIEKRLGAVGDMHFFTGLRTLYNPKEEDLLVIGGDNLFEFDIEDFIKYSKDKTCVALYNIKNLEKAKRFGVVEIDDKKKILNFEEKPNNPKSTLVSTACYKFKSEDITYYLNRYIKQNNHKDNLGNFIKYLSEIKSVYGYVFKEKWFDIGTIESLKEAEKYYKNLER